jgi:hypothetical protein
MTVDCAEAASMLDELALDVLPGDRRAALLHHLEECPACRQLLDELSETADALLLAGPVVAPPAGFEDRVLERVRAPRSPAPPALAPRSVASRSKVPRRPARRRLLAAAAAAAVLFVAGGVAGAQFGRSRAGSGDSAESASEFRTVQLISTTGSDIGDVSTYLGPPTWIFMRLEGDLPNGVYQCVLDTDTGATVPIGKLWATNGHGAWGERVAVDPSHVKTARLVTSSGTTVATATLH